MLELREDLIDGIEVGAVGRKEDEVGANGADEAPCLLSFVAAEVVENDDISRAQDGARQGPRA
jgi:hypothetical protein